MDTLYSIAVIVGLMKSYAEPPKAVTPPVAQQQRVVEAVARPRLQIKKAEREWALGY